MMVSLKNMKSVIRNKSINKGKVIQLVDIIERRMQDLEFGDDVCEADRMWLKLSTKEIIDGEDDNRFGPYEGIDNAWLGKPCFVVAASMGLKRLFAQGFKFSMLRGLHTIGMNHLIEDYDGFEWFIIQDKQFLERTTYDMKKYKGRVFASIRTELRPAQNQTIFFRNNDKLSLSIETGLFHPVNTGTLALNLALISGADPIYMLGMDMPANTKDDKGTHYKAYPHEILNHPKFESKAFNLYPEKIKQFAPYAYKIFNVDPTGRLQTFKKIDFDNIPILLKKRKVYEDSLTICQVGTLPLDSMGEITRGVYNYTLGKHIYSILGEDLPKADIYILECFKSKHEEFINFKKPSGSKVISIVHSSEPCLPALCSNKVVSLTEYWQRRLQKKYKIDSDVIYGYVNKNDFQGEYKSNIFGRLVRNAEGKWCEDWNEKLKAFLDSNSLAEAKFFVQTTNGLLQDQKIKYISDYKINSGADKLKAISRMSCAVVPTGEFVEIFPIAILEMMSVGLPIISISQDSQNEMIGKEQIICEDIDEVFAKLQELIYDEKVKREIGMKAKARAEFFSLDRFKNNWNSLFRSIY